MCIDAYVMIGSYVLFLSTHTLATEENDHVTITFQLLEMSSITTPKQTILNIHTRYNFQRVFFFFEKCRWFYPSA